ncbi:E3 ubiquitin-protein ligase MBR2 [Sesamum angolense]|uniref:RING-type E3 ubiquitin transferase n=1 Tax=Sesamum angolense TaxID=2727404 RepID=A0AAE1VSS5_9LAMI|nr:E3 ubiquitin-protein ligase MBR2 [Sesamum angolense]
MMQETMYSHQPHSTAESEDVRRASGGYPPHDVLPGEFSFLAPPDGLRLPLQNMSALQTETDQTFDTYTYPNWAAAGTPSTTGTDYGWRARTMYPHQTLDIPTISAQTYRLQVQERNNLPNREVARNWFQEDPIVILDDMGIEWEEENVKRDGGLPEKLILKYLKTRDCCPVNNDGEPETCVVCQDDLCQENSTVGVLDCGHEYHASCVRQWLQQKNICPLCKAIALRVDDDDDDEQSWIAFVRNM